MIELALETSGRLGSVALFRNSTLLEERSYPHGLQHAAAIVPMIDDLCRVYRIRPDQIETIHVSAGPGSFTGLRVGVTLAKSLAFSTGAKIVAVPSVEVIVENLPPDARHAIVVLDAKRGQVFTARFVRDDGWRCVEPAHLDTLSAILSRAPRPVHLVGEGIPFHRDAIGDAAGVVIADESAWQPRASVVGRLGAIRAAEGEFTDPFRLVPTYVRLPEAEEKRLIAAGQLNSDGTPGKRDDLVK